MGVAEMPDLTAVAARLAETIEREANVRALFGEPVAVGDHTVIPVASVFVARWLIVRL